MEPDYEDILGEHIMFRFLIGLFLLTSCSLGVTKKGGEKTYIYDVEHEYSTEELKTLAPEMVVTSRRDPENGKLDDLFSTKQAPLKRVGVLVFETLIQPTRAALSTEDKVFLSPAGKQLWTEKLLGQWEQSLPILGTDNIEYVKVSVIKKSKSFQLDGMHVTDEIRSLRDGLAPDDIFFLPKGKLTSSTSLLNPRGMRDLSLALVPAAELMSGPKFSEHAKHTVNEVAKELKLDAVIIVMSDLNWTSAHTDKHTGEVFPEVANIHVKSSVLVPLSSYHQRLKATGENRVFPKISVAYRTYETSVKIPVTISVEEKDQNFEFLEKELILPVTKTYNDLAHMIQIQMINDLKKTQK
jgi:hypothetical protein